MKRVWRKNIYKNKPKTIKKMATGTYALIITLNGNGLNAPTKDTYWMNTKTWLIYMPTKRAPQTEDTCRLKVRGWHRCTEQTFGLCGRRRGWDVLRQQHWNKYIIKSETDHRPRLDAWDKCSGLVHGKTQRDWMGREVGGGIGMGNTCKSMADSHHCMAKTTTILLSN